MGEGFNFYEFCLGVFSQPIDTDPSSCFRGNGMALRPRVTGQTPGEHEQGFVPLYLHFLDLATQKIAPNGHSGSVADSAASSYSKR